MKLNEDTRIRVLRFAFALAIAAAIATQIPTNGGTAMARDRYGRSGFTPGTSTIALPLDGSTSK